MNKHRQALTLMELVATVTAFALAAALLAPALADVSRRGKDTVCLQNLARIAEASIIYAALDENEQAVPIHHKVYDATISTSLRMRTAAYAWGGKSGSGKEGSDSLFWGTGRDKGPVTRPLNRILYGDVFPDYRYNPGPGFSNWHSDENLDLSVYRCPSDNGYPGIHYTSWRDSRLTSYDHYGTSYAATVMWIYSEWESTCRTNSPFGRRLAEIINPLQTVYYMENCGRFAFLADPVDPTCDSGNDTAVTGWHGRPWLFNAAFVDGHAGPINIRGYRNPHLGHYPSQDYHYWHCVILRGDNWQFDTLPLEPALTSIPCGFRDGDCPESRSDGTASLVVPDVE